MPPWPGSMTTTGRRSGVAAPSAAAPSPSATGTARRVSAGPGSGRRAAAWKAARSLRDSSTVRRDASPPAMLATSARRSATGPARSATMRDRPGAKRPNRKARTTPTPRGPSRPAAGSTWTLTSGRSMTRRSGPSVRTAAIATGALRSTTSRVTPPASVTVAPTATGMPGAAGAAGGWRPAGASSDDGRTDAPARPRPAARHRTAAPPRPRSGLRRACPAPSFPRRARPGRASAPRIGGRPAMVNAPLQGRPRWQPAVARKRRSPMNLPRCRDCRYDSTVRVPTRARLAVARRSRTGPDSDGLALLALGIRVHAIIGTGSIGRSSEPTGSRRTPWQHVPSSAVPSRVTAHGPPASGSSRRSIRPPERPWAPRRGGVAWHPGAGLHRASSMRPPNARPSPVDRGRRRDFGTIPFPAAFAAAGSRPTGRSPAPPRPRAGPIFAGFRLSPSPPAHPAPGSSTSRRPRADGRTIELPPAPPHAQSPTCPTAR